MAKTFNIKDNEKNVEEVGKKPTTEVVPTPPAESKKTTENLVEEPKKEESVPLEENPLKKKFNWKILIFPIVAFLSLAGIASFYYFGIYKAKPLLPSDVISFNPNYISSLTRSSLFKNELSLLSKPGEPKTEASPLNGLLFTKSEMDALKKKRPVVVMINNHSISRPQSGLNSSDIVLETDVEGGITRYMAIFWSDAPKKVGPFRSIRQYHLEWASEYDPLIIRSGCASTSNPKTNSCGNLQAYGLKDIGNIGAWREYDGRREAPHNYYSSVINAWEYAAKINWGGFPSSIQSWQFKRDANIEDRGKKTVVKTVFNARLNNGGLYDAMWTYDATTNSYFRKVGGQADMDQESNTQVYAKNVVIQEVKMVSAGDNASRVIIDTIGEGDAVILQDGKIINGKWKKTSRTDRTKYYDSAGKPIQFNRGRIWIAMIPLSDGKFDIIEQ
ncbi:MAG: DUF3048 domain-containing protein [Candidatus Dojkabacteria bacterium]